LALPRDHERIAIRCYTGHQIGFPNLATLVLVAHSWMKLKGDMNIALLDHKPSQRNMPQMRRLQRHDPGTANLQGCFFRIVLKMFHVKQFCPIPAKHLTNPHTSAALR
jgi:hypothetical protein